MRKISSTAVTASACLVLGVAAAGCAHGAAPAQEISAGRMLDGANETMRALTSVSVDAVTSVVATGDAYSWHLTTDLRGRCRFRSSAKGADLEQIRIGDTDYVRPNNEYLKQSGHEPAREEEQKYWIKTPSSGPHPDDGLSDCTHPFVSFGKGRRGRPTEVGGNPAVPLIVTDTTDKGATYTFYVATEGKPYILKVVYKGAEFRSTTSFSAFDKPLDVRPPAAADVMDTSRFAH